MSFWEPFTERARRTIVLAHEEARRVGRSGMLTLEDLLLGIVAEGENSAAIVLKELGTDLTRARQIVSDYTARQPVTSSHEPPAEFVFDDGAKRCIEGAFNEARSFAHTYIEPEHLFLAALRVNEDLKSAVVSQICGPPDELRTKIQRLLA